MTPESTERISRSSVTVTRNTKGFSWEAKLYAGDTNLAEVLEAMRCLTGELDRDYPREAA